jgi:glycosyltransferase involved in cell wall biosynthesis
VAGDEERPIGLFAGRLAAEKDLSVLIQALPSLHRRTGLKLVLIGEGRLRKRLERVSRRHPEMLAVLPFEPDHDRLACAYASADVVFAPCAHETFGLAALEAAASGVPVVGADTGAVGELLRDAEWGAQFPAGDVEGLATAAESVLQARSESLRAKARQAAEAYSWDRTFTRLLEIYREVAGEA